MDFQKLNEQVLEVIALNDELSKMSYNDPKYDDLEEKLHDLQDKMNDQYGNYFEKVLKSNYKTIGISEDVMNFTDYIAREYMEEKDSKGIIELVPDEETCIPVSISHQSLEGGSMDGFIYVKPNPLRILIGLGKHHRLIWSSEDQK
jgi:hypothetical protein